MVEMLGEMKFSLYGREGGGLVDGVAPLKYLGRPLDQWMTNGQQQGGTSVPAWRSTLLTSICHPLIQGTSQVF